MDVSGLIRAAFQQLIRRESLRSYFNIFPYFLLARLAFLFEKIGVNTNLWSLTHYRNRRYYVMRTDALDRFDTKLEKHFSRQEIAIMLGAAGFKEFLFPIHSQSGV